MNLLWELDALPHSKNKVYEANFHTYTCNHSLTCITLNFSSDSITHTGKFSPVIYLASLIFITVTLQMCIHMWNKSNYSSKKYFARLIFVVGTCTGQRKILTAKISLFTEVCVTGSLVKSWERRKKYWWCPILIFNFQLGKPSRVMLTTFLSIRDFQLSKMSTKCYKRNTSSHCPQNLLIELHTLCTPSWPPTYRKVDTLQFFSKLVLYYNMTASL